MSIHDGLMRFAKPGGGHEEWVGTKRAFRTEARFIGAVVQEGVDVDPLRVHQAFIRRCYGGFCGLDRYSVGEWDIPHYHIHDSGPTAVFVYPQEARDGKAGGEVHP